MDPNTGSWTTALDYHVKPTRKVLDYRTKYSGVTALHLKSGTVAAPLLSFTEARAAAVNLLKDNVVIVHDGRCDFECLRYKHPREDVRDTSLLPRFQLQGRRRRLRDLAAEYLATVIQNGSHDSVEDAVAAGRLYVMFRREFEGGDAPQTLEESDASGKLIIDGSNVPTLGLKRDGAGGWTLTPHGALERLESAPFEEVLVYFDAWEDEVKGLDVRMSEKVRNTLHLCSGVRAHSNTLPPSPPSHTLPRSRLR